MSDFEDRLSSALTRAAGGAPDAGGLADGARRRLRRRRTTIAAVAVLALAAGVPAALALGGDPPRGGVATDPSAPTSTVPAPTATEQAVPDGWRAESWHDVTIAVPEQWERGSTQDWCANGVTSPGEGVPSVQRPDSMAMSIACTPAAGYGVTLAPAEGFDTVHPSGHVWQYDVEGVGQPTYPAGAWLGVWYGAETAVTVASPDQDLTRRIVESVRSIDGVDPNGCPVDLGGAEASTGDGPDGLSLCRYDRSDLLASSALLRGDEQQAAMDALRSAPVVTELRRCTEPTPTGRTAVLDRGAYVATAVVDACDGGNGVFFSGVTRQVTDEVRDLVWSLG